MTAATSDDVLRLDEDGFGRALDRLSPGLLALARCFAPDDATADRMVEGAWRSALRGEARGAALHVALARRMAVAAPDDPPSLGIARQRLRIALGSAARSPLPVQRDHRRPGGGPATGVPLSHVISALPSALRVALVLHDVHGWPARDVQSLLGVSRSSCATMLGQARGELCAGTVGEVV